MKYTHADMATLVVVYIKLVTMAVRFVAREFVRWNREHRITVLCSACRAHGLRVESHSRKECVYS